MNDFTKLPAFGTLFVFVLLRMYPQCAKCLRKLSVAEKCGFYCLNTRRLMILFHK